MINSKLLWGKLELITMTYDFLICVKRACLKSSCICAHSTVKLTRGVVHFIHRVYYAPEVEQEIKESWQIEVNTCLKSLLRMNECKMN